MSEWKQKRFWTTAEVSKTDDGFSVTLDGRSVKTPAKAALILPTERMADAIAAEWQAQDEIVDPLSMPVTRSANAAIDKVTHQHAEVAELVAAYGENDLLCYRAHSPKELAERQSALWDPLLTWAADQFDVTLNIGTGVIHVHQTPADMARLRAQVTRMDPFALTAFHDLVGLSGSLIIGLAATLKKSAVSDLWEASRIDEDWQIEQWGEDEEASQQALAKQEAFFHAERFYFLSQN